MRCLYNQTYVHNRALSIFDNEGNKGLACVYMFLKCKQRNTNFKQRKASKVSNLNWKIIKPHSIEAPFFLSNTQGNKLVCMLSTWWQQIEHKYQTRNRSCEIALPCQLLCRLTWQLKISMLFDIVFFCHYYFRQNNQYFIKFNLQKFEPKCEFEENIRSLNFRL